MRQRVTFGFKDKRRDQRRPVSLAGTIDGVAVTLTNLSFHGIGGCAVEPGDLVKLVPEPEQDQAEISDEDLADGESESESRDIDDGEAKEEDKIATLDFTVAGGQRIILQVKIRRVDHRTGSFGVSFTTLSSAQFDAIERLMFPRRGTVAYR
jgi:hypothetical protein